MVVNGLGPRVSQSAAAVAAQGASRLIARRTSGQAPAPRNDHITYTVPAGETGYSNLRAPTLSSAMIRLLSFERSHLTRHARRIAVEGGNVQRQSVNVKTGIDIHGRVVALGASAETVYAPDGAEGLDDNRSELLRELAYAGELRMLMVAPGSAYLPFARRIFPRVVTNDGTTLSALQTDRDIRQLDAMFSPGLFGLMRSMSPAVLSAKIAGLDRVSGALSRFRSALEPLTDRGAIEAFKVAFSSGAVSASATGGASEGKHAISIQRLARAHSVSSGPVAESPAVAGSFRIGGEEVTVAATDSIYDIVRMINRGEDLNLDGVLDAGEDANGNFELDGGTARHGVRATYANGSLILAAESPASGRIQVDDPDGVLASLGILGPGGGFANERSSPVTAQFTVDGVSHTWATNSVSGVIEGVELELAALGEAKLSVERDTTSPVELVRRLVERYNSVIETLNIALMSGGGVLIDEPVAARAREGLAAGISAPVASLPDRSDEARDAGIVRDGSGRAVFFEEQLASVLRGLRDRFSRPPVFSGSNAPSVVNSIGELGIISSSNDTLTLDEAAFTAALRERPEEVADLFTREGTFDDMGDYGIAVRTASFIDRMVDADTGSLAMRRAVLGAIMVSRAGSGYSEALINGGTPPGMALLA